MLPLFSDGATNSFGSIPHIMIGVFCVAGGLLIGGFAGGAIARVLFPFKHRMGAPSWMQKIGKLVGSLGLGIAIYLLYFGGGTGAGGGNPDFGKPEPADKDLVKPVSEMRITLLGGDATGGNFFLIDDEKSPTNFATLKQRVVVRKGDPNRSLKVVSIAIYDDSTAKEGTVALELAEFLKEQGLDMKYPDLSGIKRR